MASENFLRELKNVVVFASLIAITDTIATSTTHENMVALLGYERTAAAIIVALTVQKLIIKEEESEYEEVEDEEENALEEEYSKNK